MSLTFEPSSVHGWLSSHRLFNAMLLAPPELREKVRKFYDDFKSINWLNVMARADCLEKLAVLEDQLAPYLDEATKLEYAADFIWRAGTKSALEGYPP